MQNLIISGETFHKPENAEMQHPGKSVENICNTCQLAYMYFVIQLSRPEINEGDKKLSGKHPGDIVRYTLTT